MNALRQNEVPAAAERGWVLYDGDCPFCMALAGHFQELLCKNGFEMAPLQSEWVLKALNEDPAALLYEMRVMTKDGKIFGGADAVAYLAQFIWWAKPIELIGKFPLGISLLRHTYRWIAEHRSCSHGSCAYARRERF